MGVDPDGLEATIKRYNGFVDAKKDDDFNKTAVNLTKKIEKGPFWACYTGMTVHHTMGGLKINPRLRSSMRRAIPSRSLGCGRGDGRHARLEPPRLQRLRRHHRLRTDCR